MLLVRTGVPAGDLPLLSLVLQCLFSLGCRAGSRGVMLSMPSLSARCQGQDPRAHQRSGQGSDPLQGMQG